MPQPSPADLVDSIVADLVANAGLPALQNAPLRYVAPRSVEPNDCPMLAVWFGPTRFELVATPDQYTRHVELNVAWYVAASAGAEEGGAGDSADVEALDPIAQLIIARVVTYADAVPGFDSGTIATLVEYDPRPIEGVVWEARIQIDIETPQP